VPQPQRGQKPRRTAATAARLGSADVSNEAQARLYGSWRGRVTDRNASTLGRKLGAAGACHPGLAKAQGHARPKGIGQQFRV